MQNPLNQFLKKTQSKLKKMREHVNRLKKEQRQHREEIAEQLKKIKPAAPEKKQHVVMEFSMASVAKATLVILGLLLLARFLYEIQNLLILVFVSLFLSAALDGIVDRLQERRIPRAVSIIGIYVVFLLVVVLFVSTLVPLVATQTLELALRVRDLITNLTQDDKVWALPYTGQLREIVTQFLQGVDQETLIANLQTGLEQLGKQLQNLAGNTAVALKTVFNGIFNVLLVMVLTFLMVVDEKGIDEFILSLFPSRHAHYILAKSDAVKEKIGFWLRGQLKLMLAIGVITFIVLTLLGVEYALTLALIAGIAEILPVIGPLIAMIPALLIGLNVSLGMAFWIFVTYIVIQQVEGNVLVPLIMNKAVGLSPLIIIVAMLVGYQFLGILGIIISVPVATALSIFIKDYTVKAK